MTPGPTNIPPAVRRALARPAIHHRSEAFSPVLDQCIAGLRGVFRTNEPVLILAGSGTAGMDASIAGAFSPGEKIITLEAGKFGRRWGEIARVYGLEVISLEAPWGREIQPAEVEFTLAKNAGVKAVLATLCETSTGVLTDVAALGEIVAETDALLVVDAVSGLAVDRLETEAWRVDIAVGASQKGLMLPPGLAFVSLSEKARDRVAASRCPSYYLSLRRALEGFEARRPPFTPAVSLMQGLTVALDMILAEGLENVWERHRRLAGALRAAGEALGLQPLASVPASAVTALSLPDRLAASRIIDVLRREHGLVIANGQEHLRDRIIRIAAMGWVKAGDVLRTVEALEDVLSRSDWTPGPPGGAVAAAREALAARPS